MADNLVNVFDPDTQQVGSIPASQLNQALDQGFEKASNEQVHAFVNQQKYGSTGQQLLTGLEGAASAATFGASTALEKAAGVRSADIQGRREENPISHGTGQVAGLVGSSLLAPGGGAAGALEAAGEAGARALVPSAEGVYGAASALKAAEQAGEGVDAAKAAYEAAKSSQPFLAKVGTQAADQAIQFGLMQSGDEVSKMFSGAPGYEDPSAATQTALTNIGLSSVLGGAVGTGFGVLSPLWKATVGQKAENLLTALRNRANGETIPLAKGLDVAMSGEQIAPEIRAGMSDNPMMKSFYDQLIESGTHPGDALRETKEKFQDQVRDNLKKVFETDSPISAFDAGEQAKETILSKADELHDVVRKQYDAINPLNKSIEIPDGTKKEFYDQLIQQGKNFGSKGSAAEGLFKNYADRAISQGNIEQLDKLKTEIGSEWSVARRAGDFEKARALGDIKEAVTNFQDQLIEKVSGKELIESRNLAKKSYAEFMEKLSDISSVGKLGKNKSFGQFQEALEKIPSAKLADKLFDKKNIEGLNYLKENYPDVLQTLIKQKKSEILEGSVKGEDFLHNSLLSKVQKLPSEVKDLMFSKDELSTIDAATRILRESSKRLNPSGTARGLDSLWKHMPAGIGGIVGVLTGHNPIVGALIGEAGKYLARDVPDAIKLSLLKFLGSTGPVDGEAWKVAVDFIDHAYKAQKTIDGSAKNVFKAGAEVLAREKYPNDNDRRKLERRLNELGQDQEKLVNVGGKTAQYLPDHGTALAQTSANAVNYLNSIKPKLEKKSPLDSVPIENAIQKANYNRALDIAEQPLIVLKDVKDGTITPQDINHLQSLYPSLYKQLKDNLMDKMTDHLQKEEVVPYKTRLGLSLFMGQPLDSTMTPQSLSTLNMLPASKPQQPRPSSMGQMKFTQDVMSPEQRREAKRLK